MLKAYSLIFLFFSLSACSVEETSVTYFDLKGLIADQISSLERSNKAVSNTIVMGNKEIVSNKEEFNWEKTLEPIAKMDLNDSKNKGKYQVIENDSLIHYAIQDPEATGVLEVILKHQGDPKNPLEISIHDVSSNLLYTTSHKYRLVFSPDTNILEEFELKRASQLVTQPEVIVEISSVVQD